jgi:hypothetical protein
MQRAKLIEGLSDSEGQQEQLGQEITGNLHTKENIENFSEKPVPTSPNVPSEDVPDSLFTRGSTSATATRIFTLLSGKASATVSWSRSRESSLSIDAHKAGGAFLASYCPPDLKLKRTVRTVRTVFPGIMEEPSVNR